MSEIAASGGGLASHGGPDPARSPGRVAGRALGPGHPLDARRALQLALAAMWMLDGVLQYQPAMFSTEFSKMLGETANGNPGVIAGPITWSANLVGQHVVLLNSLFATIQLLLGLGIAFRPTLRVALSASIAWSVGVWWLGEGLGGVLNGAASPLNGAPGAVIIYALLAVLLWPADRMAAAPFAAARAVGATAARAVWLVLWLSLAYFALTPDNRAPQAVSGTIMAMTDGEPGWLAVLNTHAASLAASRGLAISAALAVSAVVIGIGIYLPRPAAIGAVLLGVLVAAFIWVFGEAFGGILAGGSTDPNSGPVIALLAVAYWPARGRRGLAAAAAAAVPVSEAVGRERQGPHRRRRTR